MKPLLSNTNTNKGFLLLSVLLFLGWFGSDSYLSFEIGVVYGPI